VLSANFIRQMLNRLETVTVSVELYVVRIIF